MVLLGNYRAGHFQSAESGCLVVTGTRTALETRNFAVAGDKIWNSLSADV